MSNKSSLVLSANFEKLSGSRIWLHRVKSPHWSNKYVTLSSDACLCHSKDIHSPPTHLLIVPGGARIATHEEQLRYKRVHMMVVTAVPMSEEGDRDANKFVLHFAAQDKNIVEEWVKAAVEVSYTRLDVNSQHPLARCFIHKWGHAQTVKVKEVDHVARDLNLKMSVERFRILYEEVHRKKAGKVVGPTEFISVMSRLALNDSIRLVVEIVGGHGGSDINLPKEELALLLGKTYEEVAAIFEKWQVDSCNEALLMRLLYHPDNSVIDPEKVALKHDMTQPLNRYLISSSHNTYLIGDQLQSKSKADMYRIVLQRGCRCVEIDAWDGDDGQPIVRHGHTMTTTETFENVLKAIKQHAFSHGYVYPVILSIENHLSKPQQLVAAALMKKILGDSLYAPGAEQRHIDTLPSPASLKEQIIIKAKTGKSVLKAAYDSSNSSALNADLNETEDDESDNDEDSPANSQTTDPNSSKPSGKSPIKKIAPQFAELVFLAGGNRKALTALWKLGESGKDKYLASSCVSINETKLMDMLEKNCSEKVKEYNSHGLSRIYPKGTRVDSSNYCPLLGHFLGCQIVALNWQSYDYAMAINHARFLSNNGCGYVLSSTISEVDIPCVLQLSILSAFLLPNAGGTISKRETSDPYCTVKLYDSVFEEEEDCCSFKFSTNAVRSNGFSPAWNETVTVHIRNPSLAVMIFKVYDHDRTSDDDVLGHLAVPVANLRTGLRSVPLNSKDESPLAIPGICHRPALLCNLIWKSCN